MREEEAGGELPGTSNRTQRLVDGRVVRKSMLGSFFIYNPVSAILSGSFSQVQHCTWLGESLSAASGGRRGEGRTARERLLQSNIAK